MFKSKKYDKVSQNETEILMSDLNATSSFSNSYTNNQKLINSQESAFDFTSINKYDSIFKYSSGSSLRKQHNPMFDIGKFSLNNLFSLIIFDSIINFSFFFRVKAVDGR